MKLKSEINRRNNWKIDVVGGIGSGKSDNLACPFFTGANPTKNDVLKKTKLVFNKLN